MSWLRYLSLGLMPLAVGCGLVSRADVVLLFSLILFRNWKAAYRILQSYDLHPDIRILGGIVIALASTQIVTWMMKWPGLDMKSTVEGPKPLFFPSRTTHTRLFPKTHSFSYSYLLVGIPVGWQGSVGGMLSADQGAYGTRSGFEGGSSSSTWYTIDAGDYLDRGHRQLGLDGKLRKFLQSQVCFYDFFIFLRLK